MFFRDINVTKFNVKFIFRNNSQNILTAIGTVAAKVWSMEVETYSLLRGLTTPTVPNNWRL